MYARRYVPLEKNAMSQFGSIATLKPKPGREDDIVKMLDEWWTLRTPAPVPGALALYLFCGAEDPGTWMLTVVFETREQYEDNAKNPAQSAWHRKLVSMLREEPKWIDGDVVASHGVPGPQ